MIDCAFPILPVLDGSSYGYGRKAPRTVKCR